MIGYFGLGLIGIFLLFVSIRGIFGKPEIKTETKFRSYEIFEYRDDNGNPTISIKQK